MDVVPINYDPRFVPAKLFGYCYRPYNLRPRHRLHPVCRFQATPPSAKKRKKILKDNVTVPPPKILKIKQEPVEREEDDDSGVEEALEPDAEEMTDGESLELVEPAQQEEAMEPDAEEMTVVVEPAQQETVKKSQRKTRKQKAKKSVRPVRRKCRKKSIPRPSQGSKFYNLRSSPWRPPNKNVLRVEPKRRCQQTKKSKSKDPPQPIDTISLSSEDEDEVREAEERLACEAERQGWEPLDLSFRRVYSPISNPPASNPPSPAPPTEAQYFPHDQPSSYYIFTHDPHLGRYVWYETIDPLCHEGQESNLENNEPEYEPPQEEYVLFQDDDEPDQAEVEPIEAENEPIPEENPVLAECEPEQEENERSAENVENPELRLLNLQVIFRDFAQEWWMKEDCRLFLRKLMHRIPPEDLSKYKIYFRKWLKRKHRFWPSVYDKLTVVGNVTKYEKIDLVASIELILLGLEQSGFITRGYRHALVFEMVTRFYYPGKFVLAQHLREVAEIFVGVGKELGLSQLSGDLLEALHQFRPDAESGPLSRDAVFRLACGRCGILLLAAATGHYTVSHTALELSHYYQTWRCLPCARTGGPHPESATHEFSDKEAEVLRVCGHTGPAKVWLAVERQRAEWRGERLTWAECSPVSPEWGYVWTMAFTLDHFLWYYGPAHLDTLPEEEPPEEPTDALHPYLPPLWNVLGHAFRSHA